MRSVNNNLCTTLHCVGMDFPEPVKGQNVKDSYCTVDCMNAYLQQNWRHETSIVFFLWPTNRRPICWGFSLCLSGNLLPNVMLFVSIYAYLLHISSILFTGPSSYCLHALSALLRFHESKLNWQGIFSMNFTFFLDETVCNV